MVCRPANDLQLMSYRSYLDSFLLPFEEGKAAEVQRRNTKIKAKRQSLKKSFTEPGQPGEMFRSSLSAPPTAPPRPPPLDILNGCERSDGSWSAKMV